MDHQPPHPDDSLSAARAQAQAAKRRRSEQRPNDPDTIGPYTVLARLGSGGMGVVYLAEHSRTGKPAAVKVLRSGLESVSAARRFAQEIEILQKLHHPGIAGILDAGEAHVGSAKCLYCAMEYIPGRHLLRHAELNNLPIRARLELFHKICDALSYAHAMGILHRDLKPHNILVEMNGQPRILDFGVARWADAGRSTMHTEVGQILGTVQYMSPEQIEGRHDDLDERTDIYALGIVLYEFLAGDLPYEADKSDPIQSLRAMRSGKPRPPRSLNPDIPEQVERLILTAMSLKPEDRYPSAAALAADINRVLEDLPIVGVVRAEPNSRKSIAETISRWFGRGHSPDAERG